MKSERGELYDRVGEMVNQFYKGERTKERLHIMITNFMWAERGEAIKEVEEPLIQTLGEIWEKFAENRNGKLHNAGKVFLIEIETALRVRGLLNPNGFVKGRKR